MSFLVHICGMELTEKAEALHLHTLERGGQPNYKTWEILMEGRYLAVLQMQDHGQLHYWPSTVAAALVILASLEGNRDVSCQRVIEILISLYSCALRWREATIAEVQALGVVVHSQGPLFGGVQRNVKSSSDNVLVC
ncbi:hypothetical protein TB2_037390 [Malus domestica]|uniref:Cyclin C-terminal domain-containing protein n=1 Tax=Malus domestica TaxID=3750 RepID=A0A498JR33_MALDO|nr:hypothetical protein DVH24_036045 [Malus domestica]